MRVDRASAAIFVFVLAGLWGAGAAGQVPLASDPGGFATAFVYRPGGVGFSHDVRARGAGNFWKRGGVARAEFTLAAARSVRFAMGLPKGASLRVDGVEQYTAIADQRVPDASLTPAMMLVPGVHRVELRLPADRGRWPGPGFFLRALDEHREPMVLAWRLPVRRVDPGDYLTADISLGFQARSGDPDLPKWRVEVRAGLQLPVDVVDTEVPVCVSGSSSWPRPAGSCRLKPGAVCSIDVPWTNLGQKRRLGAEVRVGAGCKTRLVRSPELSRSTILAAMSLRSELTGRGVEYDGVRFWLQALEDLATTGDDGPRPARVTLAEVSRELQASAQDLEAAALLRPGPNVRAYRSPLDGRLQPYVVVLPTSWSRGAGKKLSRMSMVVGLHGYGGAPWSMCRALAGDGASVPADTAVVCPHGHGDLAFRYAGRRDLFAVMDQVQSQLPIDTSRVHLVGVSDGGLAALEVGLDHPRYFASVMALAAGGDMRSYASIGRSGHRTWESAWLDAVSPLARAHRGSPDVDWLLVYGGRDRFPDAARRTAARLRKSGASVELREHRDLGHDVWSRTFEGGAAFTWMATRRKNADQGVAPGKSGHHMDDAGGVVGCTPGPEALDRVRDLSMLHVYATGDPAQTALYRYLAHMDSARWGRRVFLARRVVSDAALTSDDTSFADSSVVLVGTPADHATIRRLAPDSSDLLAGLHGDVGVRQLRRPVGLSHGCPRVLVLATGTTARGVAFANHLPEILPTAVWTDARGVLPPYGQVLGNRTFIRAE
jgi:predicted esterase